MSAATPSWPPRRRSAAPAAQPVSAAPPATSASRATIVAHEGVLSAMSATRGPCRRRLRQRGRSTLLDEFHKLSEYVNGERSPVSRQGGQYDGDSFVFFRHSEVIAAG